MIIEKEDWHEWATSPVTKQFIREIESISRSTADDRFTPDTMYELCKDYCISIGKRDGFEIVIDLIESKKNKED